MRTIWKYDLRPGIAQPIRMPVGAKILCVQLQGETPCLWALLDTPTTDDGYNYTMRHFHVCGTGHPLPENPGEYIGTFQVRQLVFHVFEVPND